MNVLLCVLRIQMERIFSVYSQLIKSHHWERSGRWKSSSRIFQYKNRPHPEYVNFLSVRFLFSKLPQVAENLKIRERRRHKISEKTYQKVAVQHSHHIFIFFMTPLRWMNMRRMKSFGSFFFLLFLALSFVNRRQTTERAKGQVVNFHSLHFFLSLSHLLYGEEGRSRREILLTRHKSFTSHLFFHLVKSV